MKFFVPCACGYSNPVRTASAGAELTCRCGQRVSVPSLAALRRGAGLIPIEVNPEEQIDNLLENGDLPYEACIVCGHKPGGLRQLFADCEQMWVKKEAGYTIVGPFMIPLESQKATIEFHGRDLVVPVPARTCDHCQSAIPSLKSSFALSTVIGVCTALSVVSFFIVHWAVSIALMVPSLVLLAWVIGSPARRQRIVKRVLSQVPVYEALLRKYPAAAIIELDCPESEFWTVVRNFRRCG